MSARAITLKLSDCMRQTLREKVIAAIESVTGEQLGAVGDDTALAELVDSLQRVALGVAVGEAIGVDVPMDAEFAWVTVGDVVAAAELLVEMGGRP